MSYFLEPRRCSIHSRQTRQRTTKFAALERQNMTPVIWSRTTSLADNPEGLPMWSILPDKSVGSNPLKINHNNQFHMLL